MSERRTVKSRIYEALALLLFILLVHALLQGAKAYLAGGITGIPCVIGYDEIRNCITSSPLYGTSSSFGGKNSEDQIEVFLDAELGGRTCNYQHTPNSSLEVNTSIMDLSIQRENEVVSVNDQRLEDDETFKVVDYFPGANPWTIFRLELTNYGIKAHCGSSSAHTILAGQYSTEISAEKGWLIVLLLLIGLGIVIRQWFRL